MDNDDLPVGRLLSRRDAVRLIGASGAAAFAGWDRIAAQPPAPAAPCVVRPEMTEGPYFVDGSIERKDIRADTASGAMRAGAPLALAFNVSAVSSGRCAALPRAMVHVWQCDALGVYAGVDDPSVSAAARKENALRGTQPTDDKGVARFLTIYPGWYRGRPVHIHFKIRTQPSGPAYEFTSQLFFPEQLNDEVHAQEPYARHGRRDTMNETDMIFRQGGDQLLLKPVKTAAGFDASFDIALDLSDANAGRSDGEGQRGRGGPGRGRGRGARP